MLKERFSKDVPDWFWCMKCDLKTQQWSRLMWKYEADKHPVKTLLCIDCSWVILEASSDPRRCQPCAYPYLKYDLEQWLQWSCGNADIETKKLLDITLSYLHQEIPFKNFPPVTYQDEKGTYFQFHGSYLANDGLSLLCPQCHWRKSSEPQNSGSSGSESISVAMPIYAIASRKRVSGQLPVALINSTPKES